MQCAATAAVAVGTASGTRVWLGTYARTWMTPRRLRLATMLLLAIAVLGSSISFGGTG